MKVKVLIGAIQEAPHGSFYKDEVVDTEEHGVPAELMQAWVDNGWAEKVSNAEAKEAKKAKVPVKDKKKEGVKE